MISGSVKDCKSLRLALYEVTERIQNCVSNHMFFFWGGGFTDVKVTLAPELHYTSRKTCVSVEKVSIFYFFFTRSATPNNGKALWSIEKDK